MSSVPPLYRVAVRALRRAAPLVSFGDSKIARGIRGRREAPGVLAAWAGRARDPGCPTVWFHAPSVGEGLAAGAVLRALASRRPGVQAAFTHFSPSAEGLGDRLGAHVSAYLPWDVASAVGPVLDQLRPRLLAFTKTEVWPVLVEEAARRGIPVAIVGAVVPAGAGRLKGPARAALRGTWGLMSLAGAAHQDDAERLVHLGVDPAVVHVTGDPGIDSAARRVGEADATALYLAPFHAAGRPTLLAGSTWASDEEVLLPAWVDVRRADRTALLVLAPHEPGPVRVNALLRRLRGLGLRAVTLDTVERGASVGAADVVVVDRLGVLAHLYTVARAAYVGGGFGRDGLHSVLEPAAAGVPTIFGPRYEGSRAAGTLLERGGARTIQGVPSLQATLLAWLTDPDAKKGAGARALDYIGTHSGAADRTAELLDVLIAGVGQADE